VVSITENSNCTNFNVGFPYRISVMSVEWYRGRKKNIFHGFMYTRPYFNPYGWKEQNFKKLCNDISLDARSQSYKW
jgi:hypothetical protein